jgi:hypothetical protein
MAAALGAGKPKSAGVGHHSGGLLNQSLGSKRRSHWDAGKPKAWCLFHFSFWNEDAFRVSKIVNHETNPFPRFPLGHLGRAHCRL